MKGFFIFILSFLVSFLIFMGIVTSCENNFQKEKKDKIENCEMYFNALAELCLENSDFYNALDEKIIQGHILNCPACNFLIVNEYRNNSKYHWYDTVGEFPEADSIDTMIADYVELTKNMVIECNH